LQSSIYRLPSPRGTVPFPLFLHVPRFIYTIPYFIRSCLAHIPFHSSPFLTAFSPSYDSIAPYNRYGRHSDLCYRPGGIFVLLTLVHLLPQFILLVTLVSLFVSKHLTYLVPPQSIPDLRAVNLSGRRCTVGLLRSQYVLRLEFLRLPHSRMKFAPVFQYQGMFRTIR
jgi:hypothetical protein